MAMFQLFQLRKTYSITLYLWGVVFLLLLDLWIIWGFPPFTMNYTVIQIIDYTFAKYFKNNFLNMSEMHYLGRIFLWL